VRKPIICQAYTSLKIVVGNTSAAVIGELEQSLDKKRKVRCARNVVSV